MDNTYSGDLTFSTKVPGSALSPLVERLRITNAGSVGIGTSTPAQPLDVNGNANVSGNVTVGGNTTVTGTVSAGPGGTGTPYAMALLATTMSSNNNPSTYYLFNKTKNVTGLAVQISLPKRCTDSRPQRGYARCTPPPRSGRRNADVTEEGSNCGEQGRQ